MFKGWGRKLVKAVRLRVALLRWSVKGRTQAPEYPPAVRPLAKQVDRVVLIPSWRGMMAWLAGHCTRNETGRRRKLH